MSITIDAHMANIGPAPTGVNLTVTADFLAKLQGVQAYVKKSGRPFIAIEGEPDAWSPSGIDATLRFGAGELLVSEAAFWFKSKSALVQKEFTTVPTSIDALVAEVARVSLRYRALETA